MVFYPGERSSYLNFDITSPRTSTIEDAYGLIGVGNNNDGILLDPSTIDNRVVEQLLEDYIDEQRTPGTFFVSKDGVTGNVGTSLGDSVPSVAEAVQLANAYVTANPSLSAFIIIHPGTYQEILPIRVKRNISIYGRSLRGIELRPAPGSEFNSFFKVDSGFKAWGLTIAGLQADTTRQAWCFEFDDQADNLAIGANGLGAYILKSPYIQNCTSYTAEDDRGEAGSISTGNTGGGLKVDGNACATNSPIRSMVVDSFTQINLGGPGCLVTNDGYAQLVSFFGTFCTYHCKAEKGGQVNFTGGTSDFGEYGLVADGYSPLPIFSAVAAKDHYGAIRTEKACTIDSTSNTFTSNTHGFVDGDQVKVSGTEVPDPLVRGIIYFVVNSTSNTFQLSTTLSGSVLDITGTTSLPVVVTKEGEYIIDCISFTSNRLGLESQPYNGTLAFPVLKFPRGTSLAASAANKGTVSSVDGNIATAILETSTEAVGIHEYVTGTGTVTVTRTGVDTTYPITSIDYSHLNGITNFTATGYTPLVNDTFFFTDAEFICPKSAYTVTGIQAIDNTGNVVSFNSSARVGYRVNLYSQTNGGLLYPVTLGQKIDFRRRSQITAPAHVFEFVGSGTNYYALPDNGGIPDQTKAYQEINQGRVFISWTNEKGDFGVSDKFLVDGTTGEVTINTSSFNLSGLNQIGPFSRNGGISTVGTILKEVSDDDNLISSLGTPDSNTVPTQSAVYNFVTRDKKSIFIGSNFVADSGTNYIVDTTNGPVTVTLPPTPTDGFSVSFTDYLGNFATNNLIINRSGTQTLIDGETTRLILDNNFQSVELTWTQSDNNWSLSGAELLKISGAVSGVIGTGSVAGLTLSGSVTSTGAITLGGALGSINEHSDVDTATTLPQIGDLLSYNGNSWVPENFTETDPVFSAAPASGIVAGDITNWNSAYGWGDHAAVGYLASGDIGSTVLAYDANLQAFVNTFTLPTADGTAGQVLATNGAGVISFATPATLPDPAYIGGVAYFNRPTKPTERSAGVPLVVGDKWYNTSDGTEWFWNGTYWVSFATYTFSTPSATILGAGNSYMTTGVPDNNWICEQAYIYYSQLGGGGTNVWSPTAYFTISLDIGKIDSTDFVSMVQGNTVDSRGGYTSSTPTVRLSTNSQTALRIFCLAEVNDPVNGSVYGTLILRKLYV